jgi:hypothetical protein
MEETPISGSAHPIDGSPPKRIEPGERLVVLARTMQVQEPGPAVASKIGAGDWSSFGTTCLGQAVYRHRSVFRNASEDPLWSHLELTYFRDVIPHDVVRDLVPTGSTADVRLLRAEILLPTPSAFIMPPGWKGSADVGGRQASLEYIDVRPQHLRDYRDVMRRYIGPAAARLVAMERIGTFRAMETVAVLYRDPALTIDWNQIHLCEVDAEDFRGFGSEFDTALREISPDGRFKDVFAGLDRMRTIPRWTFNEPLMEADTAVGEFIQEQLLD